jgi:asparagine synthase (glutamine-hydrolysing)
MARQSPQPVKTFSIGFEEAEFNELRYASLLARKYQTDHHEIVVHPDSVGLVSRLVWHFDEPFGDSSAIPTFIVSEFAVGHVKVALTGDGGDELFGGYDSFQAVDRLRRFDRLPQALRRVISGISELLPYSAYGKNYLRMISRRTPLERYFEFNYAPRYMRRALLHPEWMLPEGESFLRAAFPDCLLPDGADILSQAMYFEAGANLTGDMLVKVDRMSMANSLELRSPLLDHRLAELSARIPNSWKIRNGRGKYLLLRALGDRLPPVLLQRPKRGFGVPLPVWFRGSLRSFLWDHLTSASFLSRGFVSGPFVRHLLEEHDTGRRDNCTWLWMLLILELWFQAWRQPLPDRVGPVASQQVS